MLQDSVLNESVPRIHERLWIGTRQHTDSESCGGRDGCMHLKATNRPLSRHAAHGPTVTHEQSHTHIDDSAGPGSCVQTLHVGGRTASRAHHLAVQCHRIASLIEHMVFQHKARKRAREHRVVASHHHDIYCTLRSLLSTHVCRRNQDIALLHRLKKSRLGRTEHHVWVVNGKHRRIVGHAKVEATMCQASIISAHHWQCCQLDLGETVTLLNRPTAQRLIDPEVRVWCECRAQAPK
mmetsp:Transcript_2910/g.6225  ORF Transcript_2910/g.6225 Transcript_2910/m.6225 type:complete len:237 (+) Transcript_2910:133-843(+)